MKNESESYMKNTSGECVLQVISSLLTTHTHLVSIFMYYKFKCDKKQLLNIFYNRTGITETTMFLEIICNLFSPVDSIMTMSMYT